MRAVMLYIVQRSDVECFAPADEVGPDYVVTLRDVVSQGGEVIVMQAKVIPESIELVGRLPLVI